MKVVAGTCLPLQPTHSLALASSYCGYLMRLHKWGKGLRLPCARTPMDKGHHVPSPGTLPTDKFQPPAPESLLGAYRDMVSPNPFHFPQGRPHAVFQPRDLGSRGK